MSGYVGKVDVTVNFDGQQVQLALRQLDFPDLIQLRRDRQEEVVVAYAALLPSYVVNISPILDSEGNPVPMEVITRAAYFAPLVGQILAKHLDAATAPTHPPSADQSEG